MEIRFWDKKLEKCFSDDTALAFNFTVSVTLDIWAGGMVMIDLEPHFYVDGERVA